MKYVKYVFVLLVLMAGVGQACELKMGYKNGGNDVFIRSAPNNQGVFFDIYSEAAKRIGCKLMVVRVPDNRVYKELRQGNLDFSPDTSFSSKQSGFLYFIANGLESVDYGLSSLNFPDIKSLNDLAKYDVTWIMEVGSRWEVAAQRLGAKSKLLVDYGLENIQEVIEEDPEGRYFFLVKKGEVLRYLSQKNVASLRAVSLKEHKNCCGTPKKRYLGFSTRSKYFKGKINLKYDAASKVSADNFPKAVKKGSIAYDFEQALLGMKQEGVVDRIYKKWLAAD